MKRPDLHLYDYYYDEDRFEQVAVIGKTKETAEEYDVIFDEVDDYRPYVVLDVYPYADYGKDWEDTAYLDELVDDREEKDPIFN